VKYDKLKQGLCQKTLHNGVSTCRQCVIAKEPVPNISKGLIPNHVLTPGQDRIRISDEAISNTYATVISKECISNPPRCHIEPQLSNRLIYHSQMQLLGIPIKAFEKWSVLIHFTNGLKLSFWRTG